MDTAKETLIFLRNLSLNGVPVEYAFKELDLLYLFDASYLADQLGEYLGMGDPNGFD